MVWQRKYTMDQYKTWFNTSISSDFGCNEDKAITYFMSHAKPSLINGYGVTASNLKSTYIPIMKKYIGSGGWVLFMAKCIAEGALGPAGYAWINQTYRSANGAEACKQDSIYMSETSKHKTYGFCHSSTLDGIDQPMPDGAEFFKGINPGTVGCHYMQTTLAGNLCLWANSVAEAHQFGNPYDHCIDMIKAWGGDPFNGKAGSSGQGSAPQKQEGTGGGSGINFPKLPRAIHMQNSKFTFLGVTFTRYRDWLFITYPWDNITGQNNGNAKPPTESSGDREPTGSSVDKILARIDEVKNHNYIYNGNRPSQDPNKVGWADCSGMTGWITHDVLPEIWNGGQVSTLNFYNYMQSHNLMIYKSDLKGLINFKKWKAGDIVLFGELPNIPYGGASHVAILGKDNMCYSMEPQGFIKNKIDYMLTNWWTNRPYAYIMRIK